MKPRNELLEEAERIAGLYTGVCDPDEYEHLIDAGILRKSWGGPGGFLGLSKLVMVEEINR